MLRRKTFDIDAACGRHFKYRDLIQCGNTWLAAARAGTPIDNVPQNADSLAALRQLCRRILDPLVDEFGPIEVTYGFSSPRLSSKIRSNIAPALDQHAAHETTRTGRIVCSRFGAAVDLKIKGISSKQIARWIVENTRFDRLYFYGSRRPLHVSVGPQESRAIVLMKTTLSGRRMPHAIGQASFLSTKASSLGG